MGSVSAFNSIDRVIEKHGDEIIADLLESLPEDLKDLDLRVELGNEVHALSITYRFPSGSTLDGPSIDIDTLADDYPDCEVGY